MKTKSKDWTRLHSAATALISEIGARTYPHHQWLKTAYIDDRVCKVAQFQELKIALAALNEEEKP